MSFSSPSFLTFETDPSIAQAALTKKRQHLAEAHFSDSNLMNVTLGLHLSHKLLAEVRVGADEVALREKCKSFLFISVCVCTCLSIENKLSNYSKDRKEKLIFWFFFRY
ncbi:hypothetical protein ATANTOWER_011023 [Ataeniobius toweri]|uniref:Uncharacterized protein n=1 Tax=Ataeniobius toweri TaxID=208326 RepID=A0ABU7B6H2_9TELE|nr:hypothetical protein [Ataeniobius toweri]